MRDYRLNGAVSHPTFDWQRTLTLEPLGKPPLAVYLKSWLTEFYFSVERMGWHFPLGLAAHALWTAGDKRFCLSRAIFRASSRFARRDYET